MGNLCGESGPAAETPDPLEAAKQHLMSLLSEMTGEAARCQSLETVKAVTTGVLKMKALFTVGKPSQEELVSPCPPSSREPANKNVEKQARFFSRKRPKPTTPKDFSRPSKAARKIFTDVLLDDSDEDMPVVISQNCNTEHNY